MSEIGIKKNYNVLIHYSLIMVLCRTEFAQEAKGFSVQKVKITFELIPFGLSARLCMMRFLNLYVHFSMNMSVKKIFNKKL